MTPFVGRHSSITLALALACGPAFADGPWVQTETVVVIGNSPLAGIGVPRLHVPANVQVVSGQQLEELESLNLPEFMARQLPGVHLNEIQGNPFQADLSYRGFTASPLLGTPQGLSVYLDGVRINEAFGDTVNWELLPNSAIAGMDLIPGSNPVFGLNTLGGAIALRTKNGFSHPGSKMELSGGSFGRSNLELEHGGHQGKLGWYMAGDWFREDGWRDDSPSDARQFFGKLSYKSAEGEADLSLNRAVTRMTGNGLLPESMLASRRAQIFTHPDITRHDLTQLTLNGRWWLGDEQSLSGNVYLRQNKSRTLNGDLNNDYVDASGLDSGANNRTRTTQQGSGASLQWNLSSERQQLGVGAAIDQARMRFAQTQEIGLIDATRGIRPTAEPVDANALRGMTRTSSLFVTDTLALSKALHLTAAARYNLSRVTTQDELNPNPPNLDGDHRYQKLNPALGLSWQVAADLNAYAGFSQGNRVPTPVELGCADPANPCTLPNSMASDPYLKQVVARTLETGLRGKLAGDLHWNAGAYRTVSSDDILFVGTSHSAGYFTNYGKTQRQGLEFGLNGSARHLDWQINYSTLQATFQSAACLLSANNSTRGTAPECPANDEIFVKKGDQIPGQPRHSLKLGLSWKAADWLRLGGNLQAFSGQYARGNENNQHQAASVNGRNFEGAGRIPGYALVNLNAEASLGGGWQVFAKINNVFDQHYATAAALAENPFSAGGGFQPNVADWHHETFVAPGAPRAAWVGLRYGIGGK